MESVLEQPLCLYQSRIDCHAPVHGFHLASTDTPCIEAGDPNGNYTGETDIDGQNRVYGSNVDIGADEYEP